jgi:hypothetical protein
VGVACGWNCATNSYHWWQPFLSSRDVQTLSSKSGILLICSISDDRLKNVVVQWYELVLQFQRCFHGCESVRSEWDVFFGHWVDTMCECWRLNKHLQALRGEWLNPRFIFWLWEFQFIVVNLGCLFLPLERLWQSDGSGLSVRGGTVRLALFNYKTYWSSSSIFCVLSSLYTFARQLDSVLEATAIPHKRSLRVLRICHRGAPLRGFGLCAAN